MLTYKHETPPLESIREFFYRTDNEFDVPLSQKVNIDEYTFKLYSYADFFICYDDDKIVGMICCYMNRPPEAYISHVCVESEYQGKGIFKELFALTKKACSIKSIENISLEVNKNNYNAQQIYTKSGFVYSSKTEHSMYMKLDLQKIGGTR